MKKNLFKSVMLLLGAAFMTVAFTACEKDPVPPTPGPDKLHEDPVKVSIKLVECHLHSPWDKIDTEGGPHQNPETKAKYLKRIQTITYENKPGKGWGLADGSQSKFYVIGAYNYDNGKGPMPTPMYLMFIKYYNIKGELMNSQFILNNQDAIHQHFFTVENAKNLMTGQELADKATTSFIDYKYVDTTPWDTTYHSGLAKLTGRTNPLGFKGAITFLKDRTTMDMRIRLLHDNRGKKDPKANGFSPFDKPSASQVQVGSWDINITVPVVVLMNNNEYLEEFDTTMGVEGIEPYVKKTPENSLSAGSNSVLQAIMKAFNISWSEALTDYLTKYFTQGSSESGSIWL